MAAVTICSDFGAQSFCVSIVSPSICYEVMGLDAMILKEACSLEEKLRPTYTV